MKICIDRQKLNARAQAANFASVGGLVLLLISVAVPLFFPKLSGFSTILMIVGALGAMVGIFFANRWVRKPRPEDSLDKALKGLDDQYRIYHYPSSLPCEHMLLTPTGLLAMEVVNIGGFYSYRNGRWKEAMTMGRALRYVVEERVSDPVALSAAMTQEIKDRIEKEFAGGVTVPVKALTVFTHPMAELEVEGGPIPACKLDKLRKQTAIQGARLDPEIYDKLASWLDHLTVR
ncbi:MAG TPA: hypothetical protein VMJ64_13110 [Anaerolineales bacterium]|nr:hypothetical protein [Anaerolineales bacterium]